MPRDRSRSQSPVSTSRPYRDRSDPPKRKYHRDGDAEQHHSRKKLQLPKKDHKYPSVNELKKRIRDAKRLLNKPDLPVDARIVQERALKGYEQDLEDETKRRERSAMIKKYHFVRFLGMYFFFLSSCLFHFHCHCYCHHHPSYYYTFKANQTTASRPQNSNQGHQIPPSPTKGPHRLVQRRRSSCPRARDLHRAGQPQLHHLLPAGGEIHCLVRDAAEKEEDGRVDG